MSIAPGIRLEYVRLDETHLDAIMEIEREAYPEPWTTGMFRDEMRSKRSYFYVAFSEGRLVGYSGFWLVIEEAHITSLTVAEQYRGLGYGREQLTYLMNIGAENGVRAYTLEVRESNASARRLYESAGFHAVGLRKGYYGANQEDAVVMQKDVS